MFNDLTHRIDFAHWRRKQQTRQTQSIEDHQDLCVARFDREPMLQSRTSSGIDVVQRSSQPIGQSWWTLSDPENVAVHHPRRKQGVAIVSLTERSSKDTALLPWLNAWTIKCIPCVVSGLKANWERLRHSRLLFQLAIDLHSDCSRCDSSPGLDWSISHLHSRCYSCWYSSVWETCSRSEHAEERHCHRNWDHSTKDRTPSAFDSTIGISSRTSVESYSRRLTSKPRNRAMDAKLRMQFQLRFR